jgi:hypothetical protein
MNPIEIILVRGNKDNPIPSREITASTGIDKRVIVELVREYNINKCKEFSQTGQKVTLIFSNDKGYFPAKDKKTALEGRDFYYSRVKPIIENVRMLDRTINSMYPEQEGLF